MKITKTSSVLLMVGVVVLASAGLVVANLGGFTKPTSPDLNEGLVAYYPFNGNANDASGNGNDGTLEDKNTGNGDGDTPPQLTTDRRGNSNSAYSFDGVDDYIVHPTSGMQASSGTVAGWVKPNQSADWGFWQTHDSDGANWLDWITMFSYTSDTFYYRIGDGSQCCSNDLTFSPTSSLIPVGEWTHLTFTWGGSDMKLYVNGQLERSRSNATLQNNMDPYARIGQGHDRMMDGALDNLRMYDRVLSSSEVEYLYTGFSEAGSSSIEIASTQGGLVGHWSLGEGFGGQDRTPNNHHGTVNGATLTTDRRGQSGGSYSFDGTDDRIVVGDDDGIDMGTSSFTVSAWLKTSYSGSSYLRAFSKEGINRQGYSFYNDAVDTGKMRFFIDDGPDAVADTLNYAINDDQWHHLVWVVDRSTNEMYGYIDGVARNWQSTGSTNSASISAIGDISNSTDLFIGSNTGNNNNWLGELDNIRLYKRTLSQQEIQDMADSYKPSVQVSDLQKGLVGHWSLNNLAKDITPYSNHGTVNGAIQTTDRRGNVDRAYDFDGTDDYIRAGGQDDLGTSNQPYTITSWFRADSGESSGNIIHTSSTSGGTGWCLPPLSLSSGNVKAYSWNGSGVMALSTTSINTGQWYHAATTWDSTNGLRIFVDGVLENSTSQSTYSASSSSNYVHFGFTPGGCAGNEGWFDGKIDGVRIYNRALTANEVETLSEIYR